MTSLDDGATFDYLVCGAGPAGSVVAGRLSADPDVRVLLVESGGTDDVPSVLDPDQWPLNLMTDRHWDFFAEPNPHLNDRRLGYAMARVLGGGGSVNAGVWARGHRTDWDGYAEVTGDPAWGYEQVLERYRRIEDWHGTPDPARRGTGGPMYIQPAQDVHPLFTAALDGAESTGIPRFGSANGELMEHVTGCAILDEFNRDGVRQSPFRAYLGDHADRPNLTVLTGTTVSRVLVSGGRATGVEIIRDGKALQVFASGEVVLSLGAINTPAVLQRSGIGGEEELRGFGIPVVQHLPGVGGNLNDHIRFSCVWEAPDDVSLPLSSRSKSVSFWGDESRPGGPEFVLYTIPGSAVSEEIAAQYPPPEQAITLMPALRPRSTGRVRLSGVDPFAAPRIDTGFLSDPADVRSALSAIERTREIGNSAALRPFAAREVAPRLGIDLEDFLRNAVETYWHQCGTARMGNDDQAVVDSSLRVRGIDRLRVADASVLPKVTVANTMAPSVLVGERAAELLTR
ncbi:GMC family oxidoreductase [Amycolatopsis jejuensis]|uniref:GMC family oxidoreductase n=1 Tax=Amycolatopsis jejuensis TaxID=330084 RepID=UPI000527729A|nr:GMC family oxidoreductase N-terminal domain-containing protein [Amycolatopsis jejuensis]